MTQAVSLIVPPSSRPESIFYEIAHNFGLKITEGGDHLSHDVKDGLLHFRDLALQNGLILSFGPLDDPANAWVLAKELIDYQFGGPYPRILEFLAVLAPALPEDGLVYFVAADEWTPADEVVFFSGRLDELVTLLAINKSFDLNFWGPAIHAVHGVPRYPFAFAISAR
jgi:hypothetical protein